MKNEGTIVLPSYLLQFLVHPLYAAMDEVAGRETSSDSATLDMYQEVMGKIEEAFPEEDWHNWKMRWNEQRSLIQPCLHRGVFRGSRCYACGNLVL